MEAKTRKHEDDCDMFSVSLWMIGQLTKAIKEEKQVQRESCNAQTQAQCKGPGESVSARDVSLEHGIELALM